MKLKHLFLGLLPIGILLSCASNNKMVSKANDTVLVRQDFKKYFDNCNVEGSVAIYDNKKQVWILSDSVETQKETLPASTFKIMNLLIALETKTIQTENDIVKWVGNTDTVKYGFRPEIYHDMTIKEAFTVSAGWVFRG